MRIRLGEKRRIRKFKVLLVPVTGRKVLIAQTAYFGYALEIAQTFDQRFVDEEDRVIYQIEIR